jgi:hypothetical protein
MMTKKHISKRDREKVLHVDDERSIGNSIIISLRDGFEFGTDTFERRHVEGFDTITEARVGVWCAIKCECDDCLKGENS